MIVLGVDPGARQTGLAVVGPTGELLASATVDRPTGPTDPDLLLVPRSYLARVLGACVEAVREHGVDLIGVERVKRPAWRVGGKVKPLDPSAIMATSIVLGAILGRQWTVPVVAIAVQSNGNLRPLPHYPAPLATNGRGHDKRRHERSAYDVADRARATHRFADPEGYTP